MQEKLENTKCNQVIGSSDNFNFHESGLFLLGFLRCILAFSIKINGYFGIFCTTKIRSEEIKTSSIFGEKKRFVKPSDKIMIFEIFILIYLFGEYLVPKISCQK